MDSVMGKCVLEIWIDVVWKEIFIIKRFLWKTVWKLESLGEILKWRYKNLINFRSNLQLNLFLKQSKVFKYSNVIKSIKGLEWLHYVAMETFKSWYKHEPVSSSWVNKSNSIFLSSLLHSHAYPLSHRNTEK